MAFAAAAPVIGSVVSGLFGKSGAEKANKQSAAMAREQMQFQERMAGTAHQREVNDLLAAGLNPILSGTGGAGSATPAGASSQFENENEAFGGLSQAAVSAFAVRNMKQELKNAQATERLLEEQRIKTSFEADKADADQQIRNMERDYMTDYGQSGAQAMNRQMLATAKQMENMIPEGEASADFWKSMGNGGEFLKGAGAMAPFLRLFMELMKKR